MKNPSLKGIRKVNIGNSFDISFEKIKDMSNFIGFLVIEGYVAFEFKKETKTIYLNQSIDKGNYSLIEYLNTNLSI